MIPPNIVDLEQVRASGRVPLRPVQMDHAARAWALTPDEAAREAERYLAMAEGLSARTDEPFGSLWLSLSETYRSRARTYAIAAAFRSGRGRAA